MHLRHWSGALAIASSALVLAACSDSATQPTPPAPPAAVASIALSPSPASLAFGERLQLTATAKDAAGHELAGRAMVWAISDTTIAHVDAVGMIDGRRAGYSVVTVTAGGISVSDTVSVRGPVAIPTRSVSMGTNLGGIAYWTTEFPFADMMKNSSGWISTINGAWTGSFTYTADGYPASLLPKQAAQSFVAWGSTHYPSGQYVLLYDGDGTLDLTLNNHHRRVSTAPGRIVFDVDASDDPLSVMIQATNPANPVHNVRFLLPGAESTFPAQPFNPEFLRKTAPFSTLRFMDWMATNGSPVVNWSDRSVPSQVTYSGDRGVPLEVMIDLANTLHVNPWFCIPHQATDAYLQQFAQTVRNRLDPSLRPYIEYSNEVWNWGFAQTNWAVTQSDRLGLPRPWGLPVSFYAQRSVEIFHIFNQLYGADSTKIVHVLSGQAGWTTTTENALAFRDAYKHADVMAIAPYFGAGRASDAANVASTLAMTSDQIVDLMLAGVRGDAKSWIVAHEALAKKYGLKMVAYESGVGVSTSYFPGPSQDAMTNLFAAANRNPRMRQVYTEYLDTWAANGGDLINQFNDIGGWSKWGFWGALEYVWQDPTTSPKYEAIMDFIARHPTAH